MGRSNRLAERILHEHCLLALCLTSFNRDISPRYGNMSRHLKFSYFELLVVTVVIIGILRFAKWLHGRAVYALHAHGYINHPLFIPLLTNYYYTEREFIIGQP